MWDVNATSMKKWEKRYRTIEVKRAQYVSASGGKREKGLLTVEVKRTQDVSAKGVQHITVASVAMRYCS